jgi:uncharacterized small protein (DUF1192 family)
MIDKFKYVDLSDDEKSVKKYNYQKTNNYKGNYQKTYQSKDTQSKDNQSKNNQYQESDTNSFVRPAQTKTDLIQTKEQIIKILEGFEELEPDEVDYLKLGNIVRYIRYDRFQNREKLIYGGIVLKVFPEYVLIKGAGNTKFSAPRVTKNDKGKIIHITRFFKKQTQKDKSDDEESDDDDDKKKKKLIIIEKCNKKITEQQEEIERLKNELKKIYDNNRRKN